LIIKNILKEHNSQLLEISAANEHCAMANIIAAVSAFFYHWNIADIGYIPSQFDV
jgi:hypothetical protein